MKKQFGNPGRIALVFVLLYTAACAGANRLDLKQSKVAFADVDTVKQSTITNTKLPSMRAELMGPWDDTISQLTETFTKQYDAVFSKREISSVTSDQGTKLKQSLKNWTVAHFKSRLFVFQQWGVEVDKWSKEENAKWITLYLEVANEKWPKFVGNSENALHLSSCLRRLQFRSATLKTIGHWLIAARIAEIVDANTAKENIIEFLTDLNTLKSDLTTTIVLAEQYGADRSTRWLKAVVSLKSAVAYCDTLAQLIKLDDPCLAPFRSQQLLGYVQKLWRSLDKKCVEDEQEAWRGTLTSMTRCVVNRETATSISLENKNIKTGLARVHTVQQWGKELVSLTSLGLFKVDLQKNRLNPYGIKGCSSLLAINHSGDKALALCKNQTKLYFFIKSFGESKWTHRMVPKAKAAENSWLTLHNEQLLVLSDKTVFYTDQDDHWTQKRVQNKSFHVIPMGQPAVTAEIADGALYAGFDRGEWGGSLEKFELPGFNTETVNGHGDQVLLGHNVIDVQVDTESNLWVLSGLAHLSLQRTALWKYEPFRITPFINQWTFDSAEDEGQIRRRYPQPVHCLPITRGIDGFVFQDQYPVVLAKEMGVIALVEQGPKVLVDVNLRDISISTQHRPLAVTAEGDFLLSTWQHGILAFIKDENGYKFRQLLLPEGLTDKQ